MWLLCFWLSGFLALSLLLSLCSVIKTGGALAEFSCWLMFTFMQAVSSKFYILPEYLDPSVAEKCTVLIFMRAWFSDMATSLENKVIQLQMWCRKARICESICSKMCLSWEKRVHFNDNYTVAQFCLSAAEVRPYCLDYTCLYYTKSMCGSCWNASLIL